MYKKAPDCTSENQHRKRENGKQDFPNGHHDGTLLVARFVALHSIQRANHTKEAPSNTSMISIFNTVRSL